MASMLIGEKDDGYAGPLHAPETFYRFSGVNSWWLWNLLMVPIDMVVPPSVRGRIRISWNPENSGGEGEMPSEWIENRHCSMILPFFARHSILSSRRYMHVSAVFRASTACVRPPDTDSIQWQWRHNCVTSPTKTILRHNVRCTGFQNGDSLQKYSDDSRMKACENWHRAMEWTR